MVAINQNDLIGSIIPNVFISRITLESSGYPAKESNPHIDHTRENAVSTDTDGLVATVDLIVKEKLTNDLIGSWFASNDITKYLNLEVYQIKDSALTTYLGYGIDSFGLIKGHYPPGDLRFELAAKLWSASRPNEQVTVEKVHLWILNNAIVKILPLSKETDGNNSDISQFKSRVDDDGNVIYDITYRVQFESAKARPEHLAFFAISTIDIRQMAFDYNFSLDEIGLAETIGNVASDIAIDGGKVASKTFAYFDSQQKIWGGPVHRDESTGRWFSGASPQPDSVALTRKTITNPKIQDFRNVKEIEKLMIDFSDVENNILSKNPLKRLSNDTIVSTYTQNYFSEMELTRNSDGDAKFCFSFDMKKAIVENTVLGRLIAGRQELCQQAISRSKINSMRIYRQRVKEDFSLSLSGTPSALSPFDKNEPWELIVNSGEKSWKNFVSVNDDKGSLKELEVSLSSLESQQDINFYGIRWFDGMDKIMSDITDGIYRYIVEVEIGDNTADYILEKIEVLLETKRELEVYLQRGSQQSMTKYVAEIRDPHIESSLERSRSDKSIVGNYDPISNRFTDKFINKMFQQYPIDSINSPWISGTVVYVQILDLFTNQFQNEQGLEIGAFAAARGEILQTLMNFLSPNTGNPKSIGVVIKMYDKLINTLARLVGSTVSVRSYGNSSQLPTYRVSKPKKRTFKISKSFNSVFDSEITKSSGADYLSMGGSETEENRGGLREVSSNDYFNRIQREMERFSGQREPDVNVPGTTSDDTYTNTSYTYLTPATLYTSTERYVLDFDNDE